MSKLIKVAKPFNATIAGVKSVCPCYDDGGAKCKPYLQNYYDKFTASEKASTHFTIQPTP